MKEFKTISNLIYENQGERELTTYEVGMLKLDGLIRYMKSGSIKKSEYNQVRKEIEREYFGIK